MEKENKNIEKKEEFADNDVHQTDQGAKPVGYGSSIQNSGNGNRTRPQKQEEKEQGSSHDWN